MKVFSLAVIVIVMGVSVSAAANVSGATTEAPIDWCLVKLKMYHFFDQIVALAPVPIFNATAQSARPDAAAWTRSKTLNDTLNVRSLNASIDDAWDAAANIPVDSWTLLGLGSGLLMLPVVLGKDTTLEVIVGAVAAFFGALIAVTWLQNGGDRLIQAGEGALDKYAGADASDPCMYAIGLTLTIAATFGIFASQVIELGFFTIGAGVAGYAASILQQKLDHSPRRERSPTETASDANLQSRIGIIAVSAATGGLVCAKFGPVLVTEVLGTLGSYLSADAILELTRPPGVDDYYNAYFGSLFTLLMGGRVGLTRLAGAKKQNKKGGGKYASLH